MSIERSLLPAAQPAIL